METKICTHCKIQKNTIDFPKGKTKSGIQFTRNMCKKCTNEQHKILYKKPYIKPPTQRIEPKNYKFTCTFCQKEYFNTARYLRQIKNKNLTAFCSRECSSKNKTGKNNPFFSRDNWQLKLHEELNKIREFDEEELKYSIRKAKWLIRSKEYFRGQNICAETAVSNAYILMIERGHEYTRKIFYLLIWSSLSRDRYAYIKANPILYRKFLDRQNEYTALSRLHMKKFYLNALLRNNNHPINMTITSDNSNIYTQKKIELSKKRSKSSRILKGEEIQFYSHIIPYSQDKSDTYNLKTND